MNNKQSLLDSLQQSRERVLALVNSLSAQQTQVPYLPGINPPIWELGHAAFFFERFILQNLDGVPSYNPDLDDVWDSFELAHEDRWQEGLFPDKPDTLRYFDDTFNKVKRRIETKPLTDSDLYLYKYAIFHLNMHIESMVWARQSLGYAPPPYSHTHAAVESNKPTSSIDVEVPAGRYRIGMPAESKHFATDDFCFDNEKPGFVVELKAFNISKTLVSNAQYLDFIKAGGYENDQYWSMAGLKWRNSNSARHPLFWKKENGIWLERHFDQWLPVQAELPLVIGRLKPTANLQGGGCHRSLSGKWRLWAIRSKARLTSFHGATPWKPTGLTWTAHTLQGFQ